MPEIVGWLVANPARWVIPAILVSSVIGVGVQLWWEKRRPSAYPHDTAQQEALKAAGVDSMAGWHGLSTGEQAAADQEALSLGMVADGFDAAVRARAEESARLAVQRAAQINVQFHP